MIKIEFKEAQRGHICLPESDANSLKLHFEFSEQLRAVLPYITTQDPMLDRSNILSLLNRSEQEDKLFQEQYKNV